MTSTSVRASSTTHTPTGRANNALSPSASPPSGSSTFAATGRPLGPHPLDSSPTSCYGPIPRRKRLATHLRRQYRISRTPTSHGLNAPCPRSTTPPRVCSNVDAPRRPAHMPLHHLFPLGCFSDTYHAQAILLVDRNGRVHPFVAPPLSQVPGAQDFASNNSLAYPFFAVIKQPRHPRQRGLLRPPTLNASRQRLHPPFYGPLQPPRRHVHHYRGPVHRLQHGRHRC